MTLAARTARTVGAVAALLLTSSVYVQAASAATSQRVVYEGTVTVAVEDDFVRGRATKRYFLDEQNLDQRFEIRVNENQGKALKTGQNIRVRGTADGGALNADTSGDSVTVLGEPLAAPTCAGSRYAATSRRSARRSRARLWSSQGAKWSASPAAKRSGSFLRRSPSPVPRRSPGSLARSPIAGSQKKR